MSDKTRASSGKGFERRCGIMVETTVLEGKDKFKAVKYTPTCFYGNYDCIHDSAYVRARYPETYKKRWSDTCLLCRCENCYDDGDIGCDE